MLIQELLKGFTPVCVNACDCRGLCSGCVLRELRGDTERSRSRCRSRADSGELHNQRWLASLRRSSLARTACPSRATLAEPDWWIAASESSIAPGPLPEFLPFVLAVPFFPLLRPHRSLSPSLGALRFSVIHRLDNQLRGPANQFSRPGANI
ncbi:hypothetical protein AAFF_G00412590 [Aldrovandia affinis]|uniref:Uncharacterized protein n=1 Tax=Aldrovandia affinis TaxID=143900 RepID=A0AAD7WJE0_9TELE|nr:hypothetical protein AAFF_G00412590 [Aldrovandia affinis]